jgi:glutamate-1-semialdehyde aminotransferase
MLVTGFGSIFGIHFHEGAARNIDDLDRGEAGRERAIADLKKLFHLDMIAAGQYISRRIMGNLSLETSAQETDEFVEAVDEFLVNRGSLMREAFA